MLDKVTLHIFVKAEFVSFHDLHTDKPIPYFDLNLLPSEIPTVGSVFKTIENGVLVKKIEDEKTKYESLPSSFSGMAFKFFNKGRNCDPYVEIKCSPAKLMQGHNLYGFDNLELSASNMIALLSVAYPEFFEFLDLTTIQVSEIDITYSTFIEDPNMKKLFMDHLRYVSNGQTKNRGDSYATTIYFGAKNSRLKKLKAYSKIEEMLLDADKLEKQGFLESAKIIRAEALTDFAKFAIRFEATIKKRFLSRKGIPTDLIGLCRYFRENEDSYKALFNTAWEKIFQAIGGQTMTKTDDNSIYESIANVHTKISSSGKVSTVIVNRLFSFYQTVKTLGFTHVQSITSSSAFYRNVSDLLLCGFSKSFLQNLHKDSGAVVIQMSRYVTIDFSKQAPEGYKPPSDLDFSDYGNVRRIG